MTHDKYCQDFDGGHVCICDVLVKVRTDERERVKRNASNVIPVMTEVWSSGAWSAYLQGFDDALDGVWREIHKDEQA